MPLVSVVVPTFNEAANVGALLRELQEVFGDVEAEFVVVDDNSKDGTAEAARAACPEAKVIVRTTERGLATAVVRGIRESRGTFVAVMDADFQHPPRAVRRMLDKALATDADLVVGSRYAPGGSEGDFAASRRVLSWGAAMLSRLALPPIRKGKVTDPMSGLFLVRREKVPVEALRPKGYKILLEVMGRAPLERIEEIGYVFQDRRGGTSKLGSAVLGQYLVHLMVLSAAHKENQRLAKFMLIGLSGIFVQLGALYLMLAALGYQDTNQLAPLGQRLVYAAATEAAVLSNFFLNDSWTFRDRRTKPWAVRFLLFHAVGLLAYVINNGAYYMLHDKYDVMPQTAAVFVAVLIAFVANIAGNFAFTYRRRPHAA